MSLLKPFSKLPELNTANILLVENEEQFQQILAETIVLLKKNVNVNVRLARSLPLPIENEKFRPRIDLVVFIINLTSELSYQSAEVSLKFLDPDYFLGKVCFLVTNARNASVPPERLISVRKLVASLHCPLLFAEDQMTDGVNTAAHRLLAILKVTSGHVPMATGLYLSSLTRCTVPSDIDQQNFD
ncbi:centromere protein M [Esox lucius]|uniref:Centromere protein M n=1 Tax=Esox lucius TaxID=8010 RepID=C1BYS1_ESOLU|nr:centromere protein M [Esox lucius]ACO14174.1 Centromere protein M [Esox lucius]